MFSPIGALPIGALADIGASGAADGGLSFDGAAAALARIAGQGASTLSFSGAATGTNVALAFPSLLGFGPVGAGPIGDMQPIAATLSPISGTGTGTFDFSVFQPGDVSGAVLITGRAPDIVLAQWAIAPGNASATISSYPDIPVAPAWNISIGAPGFTIVDWPNFVAQASSVPFLGISGTATATIAQTARASGFFTFPIATADGSVLVSGIGAGTFGLVGGATAQQASGGIGSGAFSLNGSASGKIGIFPLSGVAGDTFEMFGSALLSTEVRGGAIGSFSIAGTASVKAPAFGAASGLLPLNGAARITQPAGRRVAYPRESANRGHVLTEQESKILGV